MSTVHAVSHHALTTIKTTTTTKSRAFRHTPYQHASSSESDSEDYTKASLRSSPERVHLSVPETPTFIVSSALPQPLPAAAGDLARANSFTATGRNASAQLPPPPYMATSLPPPALPVYSHVSAAPVSKPKVNVKVPAPRRPVATRPVRHTPYASPLPTGAASSSSGPRPVAYGVSHQPLVGECRFVAWPMRLAALTAPSHHQRAPSQLQGLHRFIIDQVKFELTAQQLRWLIRELTTVVAADVTVLGEQQRGAFAVYFATEGDAEKVQSALHRGVLFDHSGAWAPKTHAERQAVSRYMQTREFRQRGQRLPRETMSVSGKVPRRPPVASAAPVSGNSF